MFGRIPKWSSSAVILELPGIGLSVSSCVSSPVVDLQEETSHLNNCPWVKIINAYFYDPYNRPRSNYKRFKLLVFATTSRMVRFLDILSREAYWTGILWYRNIAYVTGYDCIVLFSHFIAFLQKFEIDKVRSSRGSAFQLGLSAITGPSLGFWAFRLAYSGPLVPALAAGFFTLEFLLE